MTVEQLADYGLERMTDEEIRGFLASHSVGVLGLPTTEAPCLRPMSYGFDGGDEIYIVYVLGNESRKETMTGLADVARFLVYSAETAFNWRSVLLTGVLEKVPADERRTIEDDLEIAWRPDLFERASTSLRTALYRFAIDEQVGVRHAGLPPAFESAAEDE